MFRHKKKADEADQEQQKPKKRHIIRRVFKYFSLLLLALIIAATSGAWWITQTGSGQAWLVRTANAALARPEGSDGLGFRITHLSGSIPADFRFGVESSDKNGVWLKAPDNGFVWRWKELPSTLHFGAIFARDVDVARFPEIPPAPRTEPEEPSKPLTMADARELLAQVADFLNSGHWWLPNLKIDEISIRALLPETLLPAPKDEAQRLEASAAATLNFVDNRASLGARADIKNALAAHVFAHSIKFDSANINLKLDAGPKPDGLNAACSLESEVLNPLFEIEQIPPDFAGDAIRLSLDFAGAAKTGADAPGLSARLVGPTLAAGHVSMDGKAAWHTNNWKAGDLSGPLDYSLDLELAPLAEESKSPLAAIRAPAKISLAVRGDLPKVSLNLDLDCAEISEAGHSLTDARIRLAANDLDIPVNEAGLKALENETRLNLDLDANVDKQNVALATEIFFQALGKAENGWRAGLRNLSINALGLRGSGNVAALLPKDKKPGLDGEIRAEVKNWDDLDKFMPGRKLSGDVVLDINLASGAAAALADAARPLEKGGDYPGLNLAQNALVKLNIPAFAMRSPTGPIVELARLDGEIGLADLFGKPALNASLAAGSIAAAGLKLSANVRASGPFSGPLKAEVASSGGVNSKIAAVWQPGKAEINALEILADLGALMGGGKKMTGGVRAARPAAITYGDKGVQVSGLDLRIFPSGRLTASGGMSPDKLDFRLDLSSLDFKPWQALVSQLPGGQAAISAKLGGTPQRPAGDFRAALKNIAIPGNPLAPISLALAGTIGHGRNGGALNVKLELDPKTVKTLGGNVALVQASLPLLFGPDGVPKPDMNGPLSAKVRWDGALGPIWNLAPIPDRRLNGRVAINLDAAGSLEKPKLNGFLNIAKARYEDLLLGVLLTDINLRVDLLDAGLPQAKGGIPGAMKLALNIADGVGGAVTASGGGALDGNNFNIRAKINDLKPLRRRDIHIQLSGEINATGSALAPVIDGEIRVDKGEVLLNNMAMTGSVTTLDITSPEKNKKQAQAKKQAQTKKKAAASAGQDKGGRLNVRVVMQPRFTVEGRGLASIWQANLLVSGPLDDPAITGNISSVRGNFDFLGKVFALTRGVVFFGGGSISNPLIDIDMTYDTPDLVAHILIDGPVNKIRLTLTSDPSMPRDEILSRVLFGRSLNDLSRMEALQLAGAVAQLAGFGGGGILSSAKKALGVDVLRIGSSSSGSANQTSDETGGGTTLEMGKYINDYIYMGVQQGFKADSTAFIIEIELTPRTSFELRTEQEDTWGGIKWKMNY